MGKEGETVLRDKPPKALKLAFKVPTLIYRVGLGSLLGKRFVLLIHRGRKSGLERRVVLEVIKYEAEPQAAAVLSGWGERSQWYRNLEASPPIAVVIGRERWVEPVRVFLEPDEVVEVVEEYRRNHRFLMWVLDRFFGWPRGASPDELRRLARELTVVMFSPHQPVPEAAEFPFARSKGNPKVDSQ
jgi:deazaflavin-dependent oxidoreductase (nitroreductase family)